MDENQQTKLKQQVFARVYSRLNDMIPAYDFCVPDKESQTAADDPCTLFQKIKFPTDEFFPPKLTDLTIDK